MNTDIILVNIDRGVVITHVGLVSQLNYCSIYLCELAFVGAYHVILMIWLPPRDPLVFFFQLASIRRSPIMHWNWALPTDLLVLL